jgi:hypothetical protein
MALATTKTRNVCKAPEAALQRCDQISYFPTALAAEVKL